MSTGFREDRFKRTGSLPPVAPADDHIEAPAQPGGETHAEPPSLSAEKESVREDFRQAMQLMQEPDAVKLVIKVTKTTALTQLPLPMALLEDPDLWRFFDQMKLLGTSQHPDGLLGLAVEQAAGRLLQGIWGQQFPIQRKLLTPGPFPPEFVESRFRGMLPMYKAHANRFKSLPALKLAVEEDIALYLQKGKSRFPAFAYRVVQQD